AARDVPPADRLSPEQGGRDRIAPRDRHRHWGVTSIYLTPWRIDPIVRDQVADAHGGRRPAPVMRLARAIAAAVDAAGGPSPGAIGLILSDDAELAALNESYLGHEGPTDVLSFPLLPPEAFPVHA